MWFHGVGGPSATCGSVGSERAPLSRISNRRVILNLPLPKSSEANQHASRQRTTTPNLAAGMEQERQNSHHLTSLYLSVSLFISLFLSFCPSISLSLSLLYKKDKKINTSPWTDIKTWTVAAVCCHDWCGERRASA